MTAPIDGYAENVFVHRLRRNAGGRVVAGLYNHGLNLGLEMAFDHGTMEYMVQWKSMMSGDYVMGMVPSNNHAAGRGYEREHGNLKKIAPFERIDTGFTLTVLDGRADYEAFAARVAACDR